MNLKKIIYVSCVLLLVSCKSVEQTGVPAGVAVGYGSPYVKQELVNDQMFLINEYSTDKTYGFTEGNPIMVGGAKTDEGPKNERRFLNALAGSNGEQISYQRIGSCCSFQTENGTYSPRGLLDKYEITYTGLNTPKVLYINMYDSDVLKVPVGFTLKKSNPK